MPEGPSLIGPPYVSPNFRRSFVFTVDHCPTGAKQKNKKKNKGAAKPKEIDERPESSPDKEAHETSEAMQHTVRAPA